TRFCKAYVLAQAGKLSRAHKSLDKNLIRFKDDAFGRCVDASVAAMSLDYRHELEAAQKAFSIDPENPMVLAALARGYADTAHFDKALTAVERLQATAPGSAHSFDATGNLAVRQGGVLHEAKVAADALDGVFSNTRASALLREAILEREGKED